jgi:hypothetical protein
LYNLNTDYSISLYSSLKDFEIQNTTPITLIVRDTYNNERSYTFYIYIAKLNLIKSFDDIFIIKDEIMENINFEYILDGDILDEKTVTYYFYKEGEEGASPKTIVTHLASDAFGPQYMTFDPINDLPEYGNYNLAIEAKGKVGGNTITSNRITHKVLRYTNDANNFLLGVKLDERIEQHTDIPVHFLLAGTGTEAYPMRLKIEGFNHNNEKFERELGSIDLKPEILTKHLLIPLEEAGEYTLSCIIENLNINKTYDFVVTEYTSELPIIDGTHPNLRLYLNPKGQSNHLTTKDVWLSSHSNFYEVPKGELQNFFYGNVNGWMTDDNNV